MIDITQILDSIEDKSVYRNNSHEHPGDWVGVDLSSVPDGGWVRFNDNSASAILALNELVACYEQGDDIISAYYSLEGVYLRQVISTAPAAIARRKSQADLTNIRKKSSAGVSLNGIRAIEDDFIKLQTKVSRMEERGDTETYWQAMNGQTVLLTLQELKDTIEHGISQAETIWNEYHTAVMALT